MSRFAVSAFALVAVFFALSSVNLADEKALDKAKCPVSGKAIDKDAFLAYNGGKVYFCCPNCPKAFAKDTKKFAAKANHQLCVTGQAKEVKCPFTGKDLNPDTKISVAGCDVCFCCPNCQAKAEKAKGDAQVNMIFGAAPFKKGFEVKKQ